MDRQDFIIPSRSILEREVPSEIARFEEAIELTKKDLQAIQDRFKQVENADYEAKVFDVYILILEDSKLLAQVRDGIINEKLSAEFVFSEVIKGRIAKFSSIEDEYLKGRISDIDDIRRKVLRQLMDECKFHDFDNLTEELIVIGNDISPANTANMYKKNIIAFATDIGGKTSHTAIMAKSLGLPAVVGLKEATLHIKNQDFLIVDGSQGIVVINPAEETIAKYKVIQNKRARVLQEYDQVKNLICETKDGKRINLYVNLELPEEIPSILNSDVDGIGLYRTEFFYMNRSDLPTKKNNSWYIGIL